MAEVDIDWLKIRTAQQNRRGGWVSLPGKMVKDIIAVLERAERLEKAARRADYCYEEAANGTKQQSDFEEAMDNLRAALEEE